ncbi:hypothetical protein CLIB1423_09S01860 [[Candida] railenensis]|uniref:PCI domain-containing protein n=1 Tax=[Candida] railenensis TaxID=45579 RepID=A0A9P0QPH0_9ASCO|nr:hypothetical protein CLIB1423_09S01860 [[Candida] railenensis]
MQSVIIVEQELKDSVKGYGQILDTANENKSRSESLDKYIDQEGKITDKLGLSNEIFESIVDLAKLSDKEFEPTFNLAVYILIELTGSMTEVLDKYPTLLTQLTNINPAKQPTLRDRKSIKASSILSLLNNIFNFLPETSKYRIEVVSKILSIVKDSQLNFNIVSQAIGQNLVQWLTTAGASEDEIRSIFWQFISLDNVEYSLETLQVIKKFTSNYKVVKLEELHSLIDFAFKTEVVDVSFLVNSNVSEAIQQYKSSDELVALFDKYVHGEIIQSPSQYPSVTEKSKILALTKFFAESNGVFVFKYADFPSTLVSSPIELETLLIKSIKAGVIEGKLNQLNESFYLTRANRFVLAGSSEDNTKNWEAVEKVLHDWKNSLHNIKDIVNTSRENIVNNQG